MLNIISPLFLSLFFNIYCRYLFDYQEPIPVENMVKVVCNYKQAYTQYGGLRPFGVAFLFAGWDKHYGFQLYQVKYILICLTSLHSFYSLLVTSPFFSHFRFFLISFHLAFPFFFSLFYFFSSLVPYWFPVLHWFTILCRPAFSIIFHFILALFLLILFPSIAVAFHFHIFNIIIILYFRIFFAIFVERSIW